ncbi:aminoglycoside phosphotransferase [Xylanimonas oleitrophica]|uniref:Aminoglycoside phosphotransferase n=1 Tax=Xylanimonas oleitrophica TaxID=2607479 RepID=A0A2W5XWR6_9MICO|nr:phosphotransferase [Xylanimonas oleitrophica]PZR55058.1 aminoglycoside phosphotransferase [Xylanimonas oleitrophica]
MSRSLTPQLAMLWESDEPVAALQQRFGFPDALSAGRWVAEALKTHWDIEVTSCERLVMSDRNALAWVVGPDGPFIAKWSVTPERFKRLSAIARLTAWLGSRDLPVSVPVAALDGETQVQLGDASMGLQQEIVGEHLDVDNAEQVHAAGAALARLHRALESYPEAGDLATWLSKPEPLTARIDQWLKTAGEHVPPEACAALRKIAADAPRVPARHQLVHGDIRSANILCDGPVITAFIDFDEVRLDFRIDEIARSAVLLGTQFHDWGPVTAEVRTAFLAGYQSVQPLGPEERQWWNVLVLWYSLAFVPPGDDPTGWRPAALDHLATLTNV